MQLRLQRCIYGVHAMQLWIWRCICRGDAFIEVLLHRLVHAQVMHYAIMEVMQLWRVAIVLKHRTFAGAKKCDAFVEVMQLWKV